MKIIKVCKSKYNHFYLCVDKIPKIKYERSGNDYIGQDKHGFFSEHLEYENFPGAFGGREIELNMKDGSKEIIKDYWYTQGSYDEHGEFVSIGLGTKESLQDCYVYTSYQIQKDEFISLLKEYLSKDKLYDYWDIEKWLKLQYRWYPVMIHGKEIPFMMNKNGDVVEKYNKTPEYCMRNICRCKKKPEKYYLKTFRYFKIQYKENKKLIKLEDKYSNVCKETLPSKYYKKLSEKFKNDIW